MSCLTRPRRHRLLRRPDFTTCYDAGRRFFTKHFVVFARCREPGFEDWRLGMAVSKKVGSAVVRNRVKRVLREFFRLYQVEMPPGLDLVIVPKRQLKPELLTLASATREFLPLLKEIRLYAASICAIDASRVADAPAVARKGKSPEERGCSLSQSAQRGVLEKPSMGVTA